jgi:L-threonylcarbamoyladenylate synthase
MSSKLFWNDPFHIEKIKSDLSQKKVILGTSDTVLGLLADVKESCFEQLNAIKGREHKPYLLLIASLDNAKLFAEPGQLLHIEKMLAECWPGPLTILVKAAKQVKPFITSYKDTVALRVPNHAGLQSILPSFKALFSTSANKAGKPVPATIVDIDPLIIDACEYIVFDDERENLRGMPSTILDCTTQPITLVREGAYSREYLENICGFRFSDNK